MISPALLIQGVIQEYINSLPMDSKKLLVLSDTHGKITLLKMIFTWAKERIPPKDTICSVAFLGDGVIDLQRAGEETGFYSDWKLINGNNDYGIQLPESSVFDFVNYRFFICHGHRYSLYGNYHSLVSAGRVNGANVILFGHTHIPSIKTINGIHLINPGSAGNPRSNIGSTFAVIECAENKPLKVEFWGINEKGKISQVKVKQ
jgi:putative phosphoesterase